MRFFNLIIQLFTLVFFYKLMKFFLRLAFILILLSLLFSSLAFGDQNSSQSYWSDVTKKDLRQARKVLIDHSAGAKDWANPAFTNWLEYGYDQALNLSNKVTSYEGYLACLKYYAAGFQDEHINIYNQKQISYKWPGFTVSYKKGKFYVNEVDSFFDGEENLPFEGDEILTINGHAPEEYLKEYTFKFHEGIYEFEADRIVNTPLIFFEEGNPFIPRVETITVKSNDEEVFNYYLDYRKISSNQAQKLLNRAKHAVSNSFSVKEYKDLNGVWITFPSFGVTDKQEIKLANLIVDKMESFRDKNFIVFDVRGNTGGSSKWGDRLIKPLYGEGFVLHTYEQNRRKNTHTEFRISEDNYNWALEIEKKLSKQHGSDYKCSYVDKLKKGLKKQKKEDFIKIKTYSWLNNKIVDRSIKIAPYTKVILLTDGACASSCYMFSERLLYMPQVYHVGLPTHAPTYYGECRSVKLNSKNASITFPMSIFRWQDQFMYPFEPDYRFDGYLDEQAKVEKWVLDLAQSL